MIFGIGIDLIEVARVEEKINRPSGFLEKVFSENEMAYCDPMPRKAEHYAARFAAKEAFFKAVGEGWIGQIEFNEVEVLRDEKGKPFLSFLGRAADWVSEQGFSGIHLSLTHLKETAGAVVIIEK